MDDCEYLPDDDSGSDPPYAWLDEWLCEYVDGTMDPALEVVFEEYVEANPELKAHVERLRETRQLLSDCGKDCRDAEAGDRSPKKVQAPQRVKARVCGKVECEMLRSRTPLASVVRENPVAAIGAASSVVALVVGLFVGAVLFAPSPLANRPSTAAAGASESSAGTAARPAPRQVRRSQLEGGPFRELRSAGTTQAGMTRPVDTTRQISSNEPALIPIGTP